MKNIKPKKYKKLKNNKNKKKIQYNCINKIDQEKKQVNIYYKQNMSRIYFINYIIYILSKKS